MAKQEVKVCVLSKFNSNMVGHSFHFIWRVAIDEYYGDQFDPNISMFSPAEIQRVIDDITYHITLGADLLGEETTAMSDSSIRQADAFILLYSITDRESLEFLNERIERVRYVSDEPDEVCLWTVLLVGCEMDKESKRQVTEQDAREFAAKLLNCPYVECDYKTGEGCKDIIEKLVRRVQSRPTPPPATKTAKKDKCVLQ